MSHWLSLLGCVPVSWIFSSSCILHLFAGLWSGPSSGESAESSPSSLDFLPQTKRLLHWGLFWAPISFTLELFPGDLLASLSPHRSGHHSRNLPGFQCSSHVLCKGPVSEVPNIAVTWLEMVLFLGVWDTAVLSVGRFWQIFFPNKG